MIDALRHHCESALIGAAALLLSATVHRCPLSAMFQSAQRQWCGHKSAARRFCKYSAPKLAAALLLVGAALYLFVTFLRSSDSTDAAINRIMQQRADGTVVTPRPAPLEEFVRPKAADVAALQAKVDSYDPRTAVAFAIPVGGRTQRAKQLAEIISTLIAGGAPPANIFVMEDLLGRPGAVNSPEVGAVAREAGVHLVSSRVSRDDMPENQSNFGIHLARSATKHARCCRTGKCARPSLIHSLTRSLFVCFCAPGITNSCWTICSSAPLQPVQSVTI